MTTLFTMKAMSSPYHITIPHTAFYEAVDIPVPANTSIVIPITRLQHLPISGNNEHLKGNLSEDVTYVTLSLETPALMDVLISAPLLFEARLSVVVSLMGPSRERLSEWVCPLHASGCGDRLHLEFRMPGGLITPVDTMEVHFTFKGDGVMKVANVEGTCASVVTIA